MSDHSKPEANPTLATVWDETTDRLNDLEKMNDSSQTTVTNPPTYAKRWNSTSYQWEEYDGAAWGELSTTYNLSSTEITSSGLEVDGNVGIGESSPQDLLHITNSSAGSNAGLRLENDEQTWALYCRGFDSDKFKIQDIDADTSPFAIETAAPNNTLYLDSSGNVGIGTSSPARKVTLYEDSSNESFLHFANSTTGVTSNDGAHIGLDNNEDLQISLLESGKLIEFYNNGNQAMVIDSSGNVGIGTSSPQTQLQVHNPANTSAYSKFTNVNTGATVTDGTTVGISTAGDFQVWNWESSEVQIATNNVQRLTIDSTGKVGIGNSSPYRKLDLYESTSGEVHMTFQNSTTGTVNAGLMVGITSTEMAEVWNWEATALRFGTNNTERMRIDYLGNVGIGTSSISTCALLEINGTKGVLFPRMSTVQKNNIPSPVAGVVVYDTDLNKLYCYDGTTWQAAW